MKDFFYFLIGASVGAVIALLFAPQSGEELRANIQSTADENWQTIQTEWHSGMERIQEHLDQLQSELKKVQQKQNEAETESVTTE